MKITEKLKARSQTRRGAFTLTELLTAILVIAILSAILLSSLSRSKRSTSALKCLNNQKQLDMACLLFAHDNNGELTGCTNYRSDDINWMYPLFCQSLEVFVCPSTKNRVHSDELLAGTNSILQLRDLTNFARYNSDIHGHSYEQYGWWVFPDDETPNGTKKTENLVATRVHTNNAFGLAGQTPGPSATWLLTDGDDKKFDSGPNLDNYPDAVDHHGADGVNVAFADGHVQWVPRLKGNFEHFVYSYELSQDENRLLPEEHP